MDDHLRKGINLNTCSAYIDPSGSSICEFWGFVGSSWVRVVSFGGSDPAGYGGEDMSRDVVSGRVRVFSPILSLRPDTIYSISGEDMLIASPLMS